MRVLPLAASLLFVCTAVSVAEAQCAPQLVGGGSLCGVQGAYRNIRSCGFWDADGPGPAGPLLVVGGEFTQAGSAEASRIAAVDPVTGQWSSFGPGLSVSFNDFYGRVNACTTMANGDLAVGGFFDSSGGTTFSGVARWNGSTWSDLLWPTSLAVLTVCGLPNGHLLAGGYFSGLLEYDGVAWTPVNTGLTGTIHQVKVLANGDWIVVGASPSGGSRVRRRIGPTWTTLGADVAGDVASLVELPNGDLVIGGYFASIGAAPISSVARWDGTSWQALGAGLQQGASQATVASLVVRANGQLVAVGTITGSGGVPLGNIAAWNGTAWTSPTASVNDFVYGATELPNGDLVVVGSFTRIGFRDCYGIARWDGVAWQPVGNGTSGAVHATAWMPNGDLVVAGSFTRIDGVEANCIARRVGATWQPLGFGTGGIQVTCLLPLPNGDIVAGGWFGYIGGVQANFVARWDGSSWSPLGSGMNNGVLALARLPNGDIAATGYFTTAGGAPANRVAVWNGSTWSPLGSGLASTLFVCVGQALLTMPDGSLVVSGEFSSAGGVPALRIARWNGSAWSSLGAFNNVVSALGLSAAGNLLAGSAAGFSPFVAEWIGGSWADRSGGVSGTALCYQTLPDGRLLVGGDFSLPLGARGNLAYWTGSAWAAYQGAADGAVRSMAFRPDGRLALGGDFFQVGSQVAPFHAEVATPCLAAVLAQPTACVGPAGPLGLVATQWPLLGATFGSSCSGFAANGVGVAVVGFTPVSLPLSQVLPIGLPNCDLLASPDVLVTSLPVAGACNLQFLLPNSAALVGAQLHHQFLQLEFQVAGLVSVSGSNGLVLTIGSF